MSLKYENTGEIGDIIGGTTAPFIGFSGIIVTFYAFWVQYQSNIHQRKDIELERFENQYYEMLKLHKENVAEMEINGKIKGRKCFVRMFYEFKYIYLATYQAYFENEMYISKKYTKEALCDLSYRILFHGTDSLIHQGKLKNESNNDIPLLNLVKPKLFAAEKEWNQVSSALGFASKSIREENQDSYFTLEMFYYPFDGHSTRLGHYYRHLFQTVAFIVESKIQLSREDKYKYLKLLRAQLSNHEQLMLYYNGLSNYGTEWLENEYFTNYRMIKNIPMYSCNFGISPIDRLGEKNKFNENIFEKL